MLLETGADPNIKSSTDNCALVAAIMSGHPEVVEALIQQGAKCEDVYEIWHAVNCMTRERKRAEMIEVLQRNGLVPE